tara:strand:+ start:152336 stop:152614 length:279 start_codon:yes stop_codon:yes gene_type:complete
MRRFHQNLMATTPNRSRSRFGTSLLGLAMLMALLATSCQPVAFYEKQYLANALMQFDTDPTLDNFMQKVIYSREATTGGIGSKAGGGCGCTN